MIVLDASAVVELLSNGPLAPRIFADLAALDESFIAPHILDVEVLNAMRRIVEGRRSDTIRAGAVPEELHLLPIERYSHEQLLPRMWEIRRNFTAYDAAYIALAEATGSVLYTCDSKLATGHRAQIKLFS